MSKIKKIRIGTINITIQPHNEDTYVQLFQAVLRNRLIEKYYGDKQGIISKIEDISQEINFKSIKGEISIFTKIDVDGAWFDIKSLDEADDNDLKEIKIPDNLKPNLAKCGFIFDASNHKLYFQLTNDKDDSFSPKNIEKIIYHLFNKDNITAKFGDVAVSLIPEENTLEKLLSYPQITKIWMRITPPNPDDLGDDEAKWTERLNGMGAKSIEESLTASTSSGTIKLDDDMTKFAKVANSNGFVKVIARDAYNNSIEDSTLQHPKKEILKYDTESGVWPYFFQFVKNKIAKKN